MSIANYLNAEDSLKKKPTLAEEAADKLRELILLERFPPGAQLREVEVSKALGISRTPLRAAIQLLAEEGLIKFSDTRRAFVADPTMEEIERDLMVLGALEGLAGAQACIHAADNELEEIQHLHQLILKGSDPLESFIADMDFHRRIVEVARNETLLEFHHKLNSRLWRARFVSSKRKTRRDSKRRSHKTILNALLDRDQQAASEALTDHMVRAVENIKVAYKEREREQQEKTFSAKGAKK